MLVLALTTVRAHEGSHGSEQPAAPLNPGGYVTDFKLTDHLGVTRDLYYQSGAKAIVLVFTGVDSPRAALTAAALRSLRQRFSAQDVVVWQIESNLGADRAAMAAAQAAAGSDIPVLIDDAQMVAAEYGATRQGESFVIKTSTWTLAYRGPLDDADPAGLLPASTAFAAEAAAAVVAGTPVAASRVALPASAPVLELPSAGVPDYATDIAPILQRSCVECHRAGAIAPFAFASFADVQARASSIRSSLLSKRMAPWHADAQFGAFSNAAAITPKDRATLFTWARAGGPRGSGGDPLASAPPAAADWPLGPPDLIVSIPRQTLRATGQVPYTYVMAPLPITTERWLRAAVVRPGNAAVVHHALVFEGTLLDVLNNAGGLGGFFAGYVPGMLQSFYPADTGKRVRPGSFVTFQLHYTTTGKAETDQTQLGLYFAATPPARELQTRSAFTTDIDLLPGAAEYEREATFTPSATRDVMLYELNPHMHFRGKRFRYEALYPDGTTEVLLSVPKYDFNWQSQYRFKEPKRLPAGTVIRARGAFDNSRQNAANPDATVRVGFGEQTHDEMFVGYINFAELPANAAPAPVFTANRAALARVGQPFTLALAARNGVSRYRVDAPPAELTLNESTGVLSGTPTAAGRYALAVVAENAAGSAAIALDLVVLPAPTIPTILAQPAGHAVLVNQSAGLTFAAAGGTPLTYEWRFNGQAVGHAVAGSLLLSGITPANIGLYTVKVANALGATVSEPAIVGISSAVKVIGSATEVGADITHPNGQIFDQILLEGAASAVTADPGQVVRVSFIDLQDDIVQVEFSGAGTLSLRMEAMTGPAAPANYNQATLYRKGHAGIVITGANETTHVSVFSVGRANAVNQALFRSDVTYDGIADLAYLAIASPTGKFGGVRAANARFFATSGVTGIYAPGVQFLGPVFVHDINASDTASPSLLLGSATDVRITGGDLRQSNAAPVRVSGLTQLRFAAGATSHGVALPMQTNQARLEQDSVEVAARIVVYAP
ncbi:MAG: hypothetical protein RIQ93_276 [Verrucomicrobiota bacterium]|jgi:peroxiredoxin